MANLTVNTKKYGQITLNTKPHSDPLSAVERCLKGVLSFSWGTKALQGYRGILVKFPFIISVGISDKTFGFIMTRLQTARLVPARSNQKGEQATMYFLENEIGPCS